MSYSTSNPPRMMTAGGIGGSPNHWIYVSADLQTSVDDAGYFTNGYDLGMRAGDFVMGQVSGTKVWYGYSVLTATAAGGVDLGDAVALSSASNTN